jgi:two-component system chemotaxis response regulator CheB
MSSAAAALAPASVADPIRVMVVDDAIVVRGQISRWVDEEPGLKNVASLRSGGEAIDQFERFDPDVVVLDIDMPGLDGITALPFLLAKKRDLVVIMASTLTRPNAEITLKALSIGATDYIPKPESRGGITTSPTFRRELIEKIKHLGTRRRRMTALMRERGQPAAARDTLRADAPIKLHPFTATPPRVLLIGSSTGGPQALNVLVGKLDKVIDQAPVLITQHMPPTFTTVLAEHLSRASGRPAAEAQDGELVAAGRIYVAPGGKHMRVARRHGAAVIVLDNTPPINFCKPAVDPLFVSAAEVWGAWNLGIILTGMGSDGTRGATEIVAAGGNVIAQDEATSVVWGMPGAAAHAGVCAAVLPLDQIAPKIVRLFVGDRP